MYSLGITLRGEKVDFSSSKLSEQMAESAKKYITEVLRVRIQAAILWNH